MSAVASNKVVIWSAAVVGALLVALIVVGIAVVSTLNAQADESAYRECMAQLDPGYRAGTGVEEYASKRAADAEACAR